MDLSYKASLDVTSQPSANANATPSKKENESNEEDKNDEQGEAEEDDEQSDVEVTLKASPFSNATLIAAIRKNIQSLLKNYGQRVENIPSLYVWVKKVAYKQKFYAMIEIFSPISR